jgi:hypothetical protein
MRKKRVELKMNTIIDETTAGTITSLSIIGSGFPIATIQSYDDKN